MNIQAWSASSIKRLSMLALMVLPMPAWADVEEYELKAVLMEKFTHFIEWPNKLDNKFTLCTVGKNPFKGALQNLVKATRIHNRTTTFVNVKHPEQLKHCNMLFISHSERNNLRRLLTPLQDQPILTIGDTAGFAQQKVMINFIHKNGKIHFEINPCTAQAAGLKISARLLKLATITKSKPDLKNKAVQ